MPVLVNRSTSRDILIATTGFSVETRGRRSGRVYVEKRMMMIMCRGGGNNEREEQDILIWRSKERGASGIGGSHSGE